MPHTKDGQELRVGDRVTVEFLVSEIYPTADTCGIKLTRAEPGEQTLMLYGQAKQCVKVEAVLEAVDEAIAETRRDLKLQDVVSGGM